jgi:hypothetical protein
MNPSDSAGLNGHPQQLEATTLHPGDFRTEVDRGKLSPGKALAFSWRSLLSGRVAEFRGKGETQDQRYNYKSAKENPNKIGLFSSHCRFLLSFFIDEI